MSFADVDRSRVDAARRANAGAASITALESGLDFVTAVARLDDAVPGTRGMLRPSMVYHRGYAIRMAHDAKTEAGQLKYFFLHQGLTAQRIASDPEWSENTLFSPESIDARDWIVIDIIDTANDVYTNPALPDMPCIVKMTDHDGSMVATHGYCIDEDGTVLPLRADHESAHE